MIWSSFFRPLAGTIVLLVSWPAVRATAAEPRVDLEVAAEQSFLATDARAWTEMLTAAGFSAVRIRGAGADSPSIQTAGTRAAPAYRVVGVLVSGNQLALPQGRFGLNDRAGLEQWVRKLREGGEEAITTKTVQFGLLPRQLAAVHEALAVPVGFSTAGQTPRESARQIANGLSLKFITDVEGQRALATSEPVVDELQGIASGTALAAILRPLGLVLVPEKQAGEIRLRIADSRAAKEFWPVGWPPQGNPKETLPDLFKFLNVEIDKVPLGEAMAAIAGRVKAPLLIDHNALARASVDLTAKVTLPKTNTYYSRALDRLLGQLRLRYELKVDEADKPFLWITGNRP